MNKLLMSFLFFISSVSYASPFLSLDIPESHPLVVEIKRDVQYDNSYLINLMHHSSITFEKGQFIEAKIQGLEKEMDKAFDNKANAVSEEKLKQFKLEELAIRQDLGLDIHTTTNNQPKN